MIHPKNMNIFNWLKRLTSLTGQIAYLRTGLVCAVLLLGCGFQAVSQVTITGKVVSSENGESLPGVNVLIKGTTTGTVTDINGDYSITADGSATLVFSFIGFESQEIGVGGRSNIDVQMEAGASELDEVVVVGYGTQKKVNLTGSVSTIEAKELQTRPVASLEESLQGQVAGLKVVRTSGRPGDQGISVDIRGTSTFTSNPVLTLVDGIPSSLDRVNPNDIESISVLKDAASAAIYGSRAAGGVILVTTKKGKSGKPRISYTGTVGVQSPTRFPDKVTALQHAVISNEARANDGNSPKYSDEEIARFSAADWVDHNWEDYMLNNALMTDHNLSVSGGSETHTYYLSMGYLYQDGIVINTDYERMNLQFNQNIQLSKKLNASAKIGYIPSTTTGPASSYLSHMLAFVAAQPQTDAIKSADGHWLQASSGLDNPIAQGSEDGGQEVLKSSRISGNLSLDYDILPQFTITGTYGFQRNQGRDRNYRKILTQYEQNDPEVIASQSVDNYLDINNFSDTYQNISAIGRYTLAGGKHDLTLLGGMTAEWFEQENDFASNRDFLTDDIYTLNAGSTDPINWGIDGGASDWSLASVISRATYSYDKKYLFEAAARYDGSSRFAEGHKWGFFPSASVGWILSQESFLKNSDMFSFLKLRGSWGQVGNQNVGFYPFANTLVQSTYYFGGLPHRGVATGGAPNPSLTWETKESINLGIDGTIFKDLLDFSIDLFKEKTSDILLQLPLPTTYGQPEPVQNVGRVDNRGWEVALKHTNTLGALTYSVSFQVSDAVNKVIDMGGVSPLISGNTITEEGHPMNEWYGLEADGYFQSQEEVDNAPFQNPKTSAGDIRFVDHGGDPDVINSDDRIRLGRSDSRYPYGIRLNLNYKGFDLTLFGQGVMSHKVWSNGWTANNFDRENSTLFTHQLDYWTPENRDARYPKVRMGSGAADNGINDQFSSFWLEDASYFRLKNIEIGYSLPQALLDRLQIQQARFFVSGENLLTITDYLGYDPEIPSGTGSRLVESRYPLAKVLNVGLTLNF